MKNKSLAVVAISLLSTNLVMAALPTCLSNSSGYVGQGVVAIQYDLPAPMNVQATDGLHVGKVVVTWSSVAAGAYYDVYRDGVLLNASGKVSNTVFEDSTAIGFKTYSYSVVASFSGGTSNQSNPDTGFALGDGSALKLAATDGMVTNKVDLTWLPIPDADGYKITKDGYLLALIPGGGNSTYQDSSVAGVATKYTYGVIAFKGAVESSPSTDIGYGNLSPVSVSAPPNLMTPVNTPLPPTTLIVVDPNLPDDRFSFSIVSPPAKGTASFKNNMLVFTPNADVQGVDTFKVKATDQAGESVVGDVNIMIDCPSPVIYGVDISGGLDVLTGVAKIADCGVPENVKVRVVIRSANSPILSSEVPLLKVVGADSLFSFSVPVDSLTDGGYVIDADLKDAYSHTAVYKGDLLVDWHQNSSPKFSNKGEPIYNGRATVTSIGQIGVK